MKELIDKLASGEKLNKEEYMSLIENRTEDIANYLFKKAVEVRQKYYGNKVYIRGLIEFSNICKNDCLYCGIRASNKNADRYRLTKEEILQCCKTGYDLGFRTFVMQSGEDLYFTDEIMCDIIRSIKNNYPDCAITLSIGEKSYETYKAYKMSGADRYLLRHETANLCHYNKLHPENMSFSNRRQCLYDLKKLGFQVGCGFMVGSPFQTTETVAEDMMFISEFKPEMVGIGPFISHKDTPFADQESGTLELTLFMLGLTRLTVPTVLLPATTALGTIAKDGRVLGMLAGANIVMPNLSPIELRKKYLLYNDKIGTNEEAAEGINKLKAQMESIGYSVVVARGDHLSA